MTCEICEVGPRACGINGWMVCKDGRCKYLALTCNVIEIEQARRYEHPFWKKYPFNVPLPVLMRNEGPSKSKPTRKPSMKSDNRMAAERYLASLREKSSTK